MGGSKAKELATEGRWLGCSSDRASGEIKEDLRCSIWPVADTGVNVCGEWGNLTGVGRLDLRSGLPRSLGSFSAEDKSTLSLFRREEALALDDIIAAGSHSILAHFTLIYVASSTETSMVVLEEEVSVDKLLTHHD